MDYTCESFIEFCDDMTIANFAMESLREAKKIYNENKKSLVDKFEDIKKMPESTYEEAKKKRLMLSDLKLTISRIQSRMSATQPNSYDKISGYMSTAIYNVSNQATGSKIQHDVINTRGIEDLPSLISSLLVMFGIKTMTYIIGEGSSGARIKTKALQSITKFYRGVQTEYERVDDVVVALLKKQSE